MSDRTKSVPRSAGDILREMAERAKGRLPSEEPKPLPLPPPDAPTPPTPHQDQERDP